MIKIRPVRLTTFGSLAAVSAGALLTVSPALAAGVTFAQYVQADGTAQQWSISMTGVTTTVSASGTVNFSFSGVPGAPGGVLPANFLLSVTSTTGGTTNGNAYSEPGFSGMFSFTDTALATGQQNLLSGIFQFDDTGAQLNESMGGTGGGFGASDTDIDLNQLVMTSSYIDFIGQTLQTGTFTLSSLAPSFSAGGTPDLPTGGPYSAAGVGTFSSSQGVVPEPGTFILIGAGLVGLGLLRRGKG
jgi:hypothetical protein